MLPQFSLEFVGYFKIFSKPHGLIALNLHLGHQLGPGNVPGFFPVDEIIVVTVFMALLLEIVKCKMTREF